MNANLEDLSKKLYLAEKRLSLAKMASGLGIWEWNIVTSDLYWDEEMFQLFEPANWNGKVDSFFACIHPEDVSAVAEALDKANQGKGYNYKFRIITKHHVTRKIQGKGDFIEYDTNGKGTKMIGVCLLTTN